ncbi:MAG: HypC/HybG/HupF family hydrogenase formation chaperone [Candidatus Marinimicrobia bacterium]|nr:HypC/HybG/HupF family hydrogenase formation chaperone [bacterium]MCG2714884.1 HypC/HybG/HupF family hydrogenase formation chaperone [Candidatus Neomarinimicrobiota bacterium]
MCLAIPMKVIEIKDNEAIAEVGGVWYRANLTLLPDIKIGEYIIVHAGFAIEKLDEEAALETLKIWQDVSEFTEKRQHRKR